MKRSRDEDRQAFSERLKRAYALTGGADYGKYSELGRAFNVTPHAVKRWFLGETVPTSRINEIAEYLKVRPEWLLSNRGPMREVEAESPSGEALNVQIHRVPIIEPSEYETLQNDGPSVSSYCLAMGNFSSQTFAYQLRDNALVPEALSGMIAVVDPLNWEAKTPGLSKKPVVVLDNNTFLAGTYIWHGNPMIEPRNREYRPVQLSDNHKVVGVIVAFSQRDT
ncbi:helix-turn-helix domain-containing protein [Marinobacter sp. 71-i]|uniref:Helix-turn-helix domain-containing protein n=1 Tax=Marinobacter iranensis TaxID=2962607 RepID=A0ABT5Y9J6_9GAMM|nr:helix-turn-helix transcriptional regulator [Marinobacter iranensis]MDF0750324.1 helix-turn-helix domain-containing protein [Marinobacter iranensis]